MPDDQVPDDAVQGASPDPEAGAAKHSRIAAGRERVEHQITSTYQRLEEARPSSGPIDTAFRAFERDNDAGGGVLSAAVAFRAFLFLVPYAFFCVVTFGLASEVSSESADQLARSVGVTGLVARAFTSAANLDTGDRIWAMCISGFATYLAARAVVKVMRITHGLIWRVRVPKIAHSSRAAGLVVGLVTTHSSSELVFRGCGRSPCRSRSSASCCRPPSRSACGCWRRACSRTPTVRGGRSRPAPGCSRSGMTGLQAATVFYFAGSIERKSDTYGAIGTSLALLLWAYVLGRIVIASISLNAAFWYRSEERPGGRCPRPSTSRTSWRAARRSRRADDSGGRRRWNVGQLTILAFICWNSASVITPWLLRSARRASSSAGLALGARGLLDVRTRGGVLPVARPPLRARSSCDHVR